MTVVVEEKRTDIVYNTSACNRCGMCIEVCPFNVWELPDTGPAIMARPDDCTNCTACAKNCLGNAIAVQNFGCGCIWSQAKHFLGLSKDTTVGSQGEEESSSDSSCCG